MDLKQVNIDEIEDINFDDEPVIDEEVVLSSEEGELLSSDKTDVIIPRCEFLTGGAGTGKTYQIKKRMEEYEQEHEHSRTNRYYGVLAATTGIAAINLGDGTSTVNSVLRYFDTQSLKENYTSGKLHQALKEVARKAGWLIIDECSMMEAMQLDIIWDALTEINQQAEVVEIGGLGLILTGDFCQLPPVANKDSFGKELPVKYCFDALCWKYFEQYTTKLTKVWRQSDSQFIKALESARRGDGAECAEILRQHNGVKFREEIDTNFDGTTIFSKNVEVDRLNQTRLRNLLHSDREEIIVKSFRWGKQRGEWKLIPEELHLCKDAYVMILANDSRACGFRYANGSTGYVEGWEKVQGFSIRLKDRFNREVCYNDVGGEFEDKPLVVEINKICRQVKVKDHPQDISKPEYESYKEWKESHSEEYESAKQAKFLYLQYLRNLTNRMKPKTVDGKFKGDIYYDYEDGKWVVGEVYYYPLRLAYASTVHKSQGLTLDTVQIDFSNKFFGNASMGYVALSRVRTAEGLRIVGSPRLLESRINISRKVLKWI